jgi:hypothetical protein
LWYSVVPLRQLIQNPTLTSRNPTIESSMNNEKGTGQPENLKEQRRQMPRTFIHPIIILREYRPYGLPKEPHGVP